MTELFKAVYVYLVNQLPHPEAIHLASRLNHKYEKLLTYEQVANVGFIVVEGSYSADGKVLDTNDEVVDYINERNSAVLAFRRVELGFLEGGKQ